LKVLQYALKTSDLPRNDIALLVAGAGTGGTITGLAHAIRDDEKVDGGLRTTVLAVDPEGSILGGGEPGNYEVEGIGYVRMSLPFLDTEVDTLQDFFPEVLDPKAPTVDQWVKTNDKEAFAMAKRIMFVPLFYLSQAELMICLAGQKASSSVALAVPPCQAHCASFTLPPVPPSPMTRQLMLWSSFPMACGTT